MEYKNIFLEKKSKTVYITINRPKQLNALNLETIKELSDAIIKTQNDSKIRSVLITGSEDKAFVAGADIKEFASFNVQEGESLARKGQELLFDLIENSSKPIIAAINGFALGGGLELAMSCHIRIASNNSKLGLPEVSLGLIPGYGGTQRLASLVGKGKAMEMICTASMISAEEALNLGLVNHICDQEKLMLLCEEILNKISKNSGNAISAAIKSINDGFKTSINGYETEKKEFGKCFGTKEFIEGTTAFLEKRKANF